jgi:hypothetical protein
MEGLSNFETDLPPYDQRRGVPKCLGTGYPKGDRNGGDLGGVYRLTLYR